MSRTRHAALAATAICALLAAGTARADVIYSYDGKSSSSVPNTGGFIPELTLSLDITNAAVQSGSFTLNGSGGTLLPAATDYSGDVAQWVSLSGNVIPGPITSAVALPQGQFQLALTFDPASGAVTSTSFESAFGNIPGGRLNGTGNLASGYVQADSPLYASCLAAGIGVPGVGDACAVSGTWTETGYDPSNPVPEPATFAVLGAGLLGFAAVRRRA